jgi:hypothetical protein
MGMHVSGCLPEQSEVSRAGSVHTCSRSSWLQVFFRVEGKGCCEQGAAVVLKRAPEAPDHNQIFPTHAPPELSTIAAPSELQQSISATGSGQREVEDTDGLKHAIKEDGIDDGTVIGFATTAFKPELNGMSGGHACVRLASTDLDLDISEALHIVNPYAPGTFRKINLTAWRRMQ